MKKIWKVVKTVLLISVLLLAGQVPVGPRTISGHLVHSLYEAIVWIGNSLREAEWFGRMSESKRESAEVKKAPAPRVASLAPALRPAPRADSTSDELTERVIPPAPAVREEPVIENEQIGRGDQESLIKLLDQ